MNDVDLQQLRIAIECALTIADEIQEPNVLLDWIKTLGEEQQALTLVYIEGLKSGEINHPSREEILPFADKVADQVMLNWVGLDSNEATMLLVELEIKNRVDDLSHGSGLPSSAQAFVEGLQGRKKKFAWYHMNRVLTGRRDPLVSDEHWNSIADGSAIENLSPEQQLELLKTPEVQATLKMMNNVDRFIKQYNNKEERAGFRSRIKRLFS